MLKFIEKITFLKEKSHLNLLFFIKNTIKCKLNKKFKEEYNKREFN